MQVGSKDDKEPLGARASEEEVEQFKEELDATAVLSTEEDEELNRMLQQYIEQERAQMEADRDVAFDVWRKWWRLGIEWPADPEAGEAWNGAVETIAKGIGNVVLLAMEEAGTLTETDADLYTVDMVREKILAIYLDKRYK